MSYLNKDFLLKNKTAQKLYHGFAENMPIFDYHCHLSEKEIFEDKPINDIYDAWLSADHYKWSLMRNYGISEEYITGSKPKKEKFIQFCKVVGTAIGHPIYHWSQLELENYFHCKLEINEKNAETIWEQANAYIKANNLTPSKLILESNVKYIFTTNHPLDDLEVFDKINSQNRGYKVFPAFRGDALVNINAKDFTSLCERMNAKTLDEFESKIVERIAEFVKHGAKASDISFAHICNNFDRKLAVEAFKARLANKELSKEQTENYIGYMAYFLGKEFHKANFAFEIHLGARRNNNTKMFNKLGPDSGYDSISEDNTATNLSLLLDRLDSEDSLPKVILFNLNKKINTELLTLVFCFQDDSAKGKIQYGPAWWFLDNKNGIENHLKDLSCLGHLDSFVGMLTDSRSFLSYQRHQYFRRILCNFIGELVENGEATKDFDILEKVIKDICYYNSVNYFEIEK